MNPLESLASEAARLDAADPLTPLRGRFHHPDPLTPGGDHIIYLTGNSLGLQPRSARRALEERMVQWDSMAVRAWHDADWMDIEASLAELMAPIVGANPAEVAVGGSLTANIHHLMATFYRPADGRTKILMEADAFPSDQYAVASQVDWHGLVPSAEVVMVEGDDDAVLEAIEIHRESLALVLLAGINYYTGRVFDMGRISAAARSAGATVGLDLAHAAGNVPLRLHDWNVDFAAWCGYKYLNGGPGAPAAFFVHEQHHGTEAPRLAGWWGHDPASRFLMPDAFSPAPGAAGWQISTPSVLALAPLEASLSLFREVGFERLVARSRRLTAFLDRAIQEALGTRVRVLTPPERGAQLSLKVEGGRTTFERLSAAGVVCDWREPDVIRAAPVPMYNSFGEMVEFCERLGASLPDS
ncbi:MAG: kynureninase [Rhodothermales bacterium]|nr:kynureninase [Rhodothermales bacterium]